MAQVLVTSENYWYQGIASLRNLYEKKLEQRVLKYSSTIFSGYFSFQSAFTFQLKGSTETAGSDILLIAEDFSKWVIVELELMGKPLAHTRKQLKVFSSPTFTASQLVKHCISKDPRLTKYKSELEKLFNDYDPELLVIFDSYHKPTLDEISRDFSCKICVFEVYKTSSHDLELFRLSGDYPYIKSGFCFLKSWPSNYDQYEVQRPDLFDGFSPGRIQIHYRMRTIEAILMVARSRYFLKIPENPMPPGEDLKIFRTFDKKFVIEKL